jgi:COP9 signalosome complex subunit 2
MTDLVDAYQRDDIHQYEYVLNTNKDLLSDPFIAENIDEVTRNMRTKAVLKLIAPYTRFNLAFIGKALKIPVEEVQDILGFLIVDKKVNGKINQQAGTVEIEDDRDKERIRAMKEWTEAIGSLYRTVFTDSEGFKIPEMQGADGEGMTLPGLHGRVSQPAWGGGSFGHGKKQGGKGKKFANMLFTG